MVVMVATITINLALYFDLCFSRKDFEWLLLPLCFWYIGDIRAFSKVPWNVCGFWNEEKKCFGIFVLHMYCNYVCRISLKKDIVQIASIVCISFVKCICWKYILDVFSFFQTKWIFIIIFINNTLHHIDYTLATIT